MKSTDQCRNYLEKKEVLWTSCEECNVSGLYTGQSVLFKQPDQTESEAKTNTSGFQSGTEKLSSSSAEMVPYTVTAPMEQSFSDVLYPLSTPLKWNKTAFVSKSRVDVIISTLFQLLDSLDSFFFFLDSMIFLIFY